MTQYLLDTFTGTGGTLLTAHDPDVGDVGSWSSGGAGFDLDGAGNTRVTVNNTITYGYNTTAHAGDDYEVVSKVVFNGTTDTYICGACARVQAADVMYIMWLKGNGEMQLKRRDGGAGTGIDIDTMVTGIPVSSGATYNLHLRAQGPLISARVVRDSDQVELASMSAIDATYSTGDFGIISRSNISDIVEIDVNSIDPPPSTTLTTDIVVNNSGSVLSNQLMYWTWLPEPSNRIGELNTASAIQGSDVTDNDGRLTVSVGGTGTLLAAVRNSDASTDYVYYQVGTAE